MTKKTMKIVAKAIKGQIVTQKHELTHFAEAYTSNPSGMTRNYLIRSAKEVAALEQLLTNYEVNDND